MTLALCERQRAAAEAAYKRFAEQNLGSGGLCPPGQVKCGVPAKSKILWGCGKKKMRSLGTVQVPTEAFLAVLKLDE